MKKPTKITLSINSTKILVRILNLINKKILQEDVVNALFESMSRKIKETNEAEETDDCGFITMIEALPGERHRPGFPFLRKASVIEIFAFAQLTAKANNFSSKIKSRSFDGKHFLVAEIKQGKNKGSFNLSISDEKSLSNETLNLYILSEQIH